MLRQPQAPSRHGAADVSAETDLRKKQVSMAFSTTKTRINVQRLAGKLSIESRRRYGQGIHGDPGSRRITACPGADPAALAIARLGQKEIAATMPVRPLAKRPRASILDRYS